MGDDRKLSEKLEYFKLDRPSEWMMAEYIRDAKKLETKLGSLPGQLDRIEAKLDQLLAKKKPKARASKKVEYPVYPDWFEDIWKIKPKRDGGNPKMQAYAQCTARIDEGYSDDRSTNDVKSDMHSGLVAYRQWCNENGSIGTKHVYMVRTFFGREKYYLEAWDIPITPDNVPRDNDKLESFALEHGYRLAWSGETFTDWRKALEKIHRKENRNVQK